MHDALSLLVMPAPVDQGANASKGWPRGQSNTVAEAYRATAPMNSPIGSQIPVKT
ncbi:hypothetical protein WL1483_630 [Aeromonas schubertii]|uniref:Uncharacterized protein n=1 Tax=Aeromonas schubertii TaxID=652 RepID=A0A0S2SED6_9GAMM|nr:hypothetical protein WL1483_630 [Aeromonas schubertii]